MNVLAMPLNAGSKALQILLHLNKRSHHVWCDFFIAHTSCEIVCRTSDSGQRICWPKWLQCAFSPLKSQAAVAFCMETGSVLCQNGMRFVSKRKVFWPKSPYILLPRPVSSSVTNRQQEAHEPAAGGSRTGSRRATNRQQETREAAGPHRLKVGAHRLKWCSTRLRRLSCTEIGWLINRLKC